MSLPHALLGLLNRFELTGYDMARIFDHSLAPFWPTEHTQIYRALGRLVETGQVGYRVEEQEGKPNRKVYSLLEPGRKMLEAWLREPSPLAEIRHAQLLQFSFLGDQTPEVIRGFLDRYRVQVEDKLREYERVDRLQKALELTDSSKEKLLWELVLDNGISYYRHELQWIDRAMAAFAGLGRQ